MTKAKKSKPKSPPVSLAPFTPNQAIFGLLQVKPPKKDKPKRWPKAKKEDTRRNIRIFAVHGMIVFAFIAVVVTASTRPAAANAFEKGYEDGINNEGPVLGIHNPQAWTDYNVGYEQGRAEAEEDDAEFDRWLQESKEQTQRSYEDGSSNRLHSAKPQTDYTHPSFEYVH